MIGLAFSFLSACCLCYSTFGKQKENILKWQVANTSFLILANLFLKGYSGMATNVVCLVRNILGAKGRLNRTNTIVLTILIVVAGVAVNNRGLLGLLPVVASVEYSICMYLCKNAQQMRLALAVNVALWAIYDFAIGSYPMFATDLIVAGASVLNVFRFQRPGKDKADAAGST